MHCDQHNWDGTYCRNCYMTCHHQLTDTGCSLCGASLCSHCGGVYGEYDDVGENSDFSITGARRTTCCRLELYAISSKS